VTPGFHDFGFLGQGHHPHGTRANYKTGCRCLACRAANAAYIASLRARHRHQRPILGSHVPAAPAWRMVKSLGVEQITEADIAKAFGLKDPRLRWHTTRITLRNLLKLHRFYRMRMD
jgi:hypothetical protein